MKSIIHDKKEKTCLLCKIIDDDNSEKGVLHEHHCIHGTANRRLSEKYGLKIYLCPFHHTDGEYAVHKNARVDNSIAQIAQIYFNRNYPDKSFVEIFGKNYL